MADTPQAKKRVEQPENPADVSLQTNIESASGDIQSLKRQRADLENKLKMYRKRLEDAPKVEQAYLALNRDYQNAHTKHQEIMNKSWRPGLPRAWRSPRRRRNSPSSTPPVFLKSRWPLNGG